MTTQLPLRKHKTVEHPSFPPPPPPRVPEDRQVAELPSYPTAATPTLPQTGRTAPSPEPQDEDGSGLITLGYITAVLIPFVGFILGIVAVTRKSARVSKHGVRIIALSVVVFAIGTVAIMNSINKEATRASEQATQQLQTLEQNARREAQQTEETLRNEAAAAEQQTTEERMRQMARESAQAPRERGE